MDYYTVTQKKRARLAGTARDRTTARTSMLMYRASRGKAFEEMKAVVKRGRLKRKAEKEGREVDEDEKDTTGPTELEIRGIGVPGNRSAEVAEAPKEGTSGSPT